jgi:hypothetical protein
VLSDASDMPTVSGSADGLRNYPECNRGREGDPLSPRVFVGAGSPTVFALAESAARYICDCIEDGCGKKVERQAPVRAAFRVAGASVDRDCRQDAQAIQSVVSTQMESGGNERVGRLFRSAWLWLVNPPALCSAEVALAQPSRAGLASGQKRMLPGPSAGASTRVGRIVSPLRGAMA